MRGRSNFWGQMTGETEKFGGGGQTNDHQCFNRAPFFVAKFYRIKRNSEINRLLDALLAEVFCASSEKLSTHL